MAETKKSFCRFCHGFCGVEVDVEDNPLLLNPRAMQSLGVEDGDIVVVDSGFGSLEGIVEATEDLAPGVVALAHGWGDPSDDRDIREKGSNVQRLIPDDQRYDPVTGLALQSAVPVNVSPSRACPPRLTQTGEPIWVRAIHRRYRESRETRFAVVQAGVGNIFP
jgi:anaerobic selenocysteine-containing dehydrogenase